MPNRTILFILVLTAFFPGCERFSANHKSEPLEIVGQVIDSDTLEPIDGAFVLSTYDLQRVP